MLSTTLIDTADLRDWVSRRDAVSAAKSSSLAPAGLVAEQWVILDCRFDLAAPEAGRQAYLRGHIPGARFIDLNRDLAAPVSPTSGRHPLPAPDTLAQRLAALGIDDSTPVVVYDAANGSMAARAWWLLRWRGHARVAVLDGGFQAWLAAGGEIETGEHPSPGMGSSGAASFDAASPAASSTIASTNDVLRSLRDPTQLLIDARAAERFLGSVEPIDAVAGHIPGAVSHPFSLNLDAQGRFLPAAELRRRWQQRLGSTAPHDVTVMCGSGVTACHNLLAMEIAGFPGAKLYAGSWSEWIRDPERPVAQGSEP